MRVLVQSHASAHTPETLFQTLKFCPDKFLLRTGQFDVAGGRYSMVGHAPLLTFESRGACCRWTCGGRRWSEYGNPWEILRVGLGRFELLDEQDFPFPLGGVFGFWGYGLGEFMEPRLPRSRRSPTPWPDCRVGFHTDLIVFDHWMDRTWIVSTGLNPDGSHNPRQAQIQLDKWRLILDQTQATSSVSNGQPLAMTAPIRSSMSRAGYVQAVQRAQQFIRNGDIYQVNLTHRLATPQRVDPSNFFTRLSHLSPAPYSAIFDFPERALVSSSPELFLRMSGRQITSRPIKGTRPRSSDPLRDAQWMYELQTSEKETAELVMITDLLRNDLGRISEYGSVQVPDLLRLERFRQVQHLVSTVEGRLRPELDHLQALAACFPGGSITGAPKLRAMQIIHELEPVFRGPYCGAIGYLGFNRESQLSIAIRTAQLDSEGVAFHVGAGIVADSDPEAEYAETLAKARGFLDMWQWPEKQVQGSEPFQITHHP